MMVNSDTSEMAIKVCFMGYSLLGKMNRIVEWFNGIPFPRLDLTASIALKEFRPLVSRGFPAGNDRPHRSHRKWPAGNGRPTADPRLW